MNWKNIETDAVISDEDFENLDFEEQCDYLETNEEPTHHINDDGGLVSTLIGAAIGYEIGKALSSDDDDEPATGGSGGNDNDFEGLRRR